jgi:hypothetical protein
MNKEHVFLKALLNRKNSKEYAPFLSAPLSASIQRAPTIEFQFDPFCLNLQTLLKKKHYSWLLDTLNTLPQKNLKLYLAALDKTIRAKLMKHFKLEEVLPIENPFLKKVLLTNLAKQTVDFSILPTEYLDKNPLLKLLDCTKEQLEYLFNFLGLYDLAKELKEVVDKNILLKVRHTLSDKENAFLDTLISQKTLWSLPKIGLRTWVEEDVHRRLQKQGLTRCALALSGSQPDFIKHVCYKLDRGRGQFILKVVKEKPLIPATKICQGELMSLLNVFEPNIHEVV